MKQEQGYNSSPETEAKMSTLKETSLNPDAQQLPTGEVCIPNISQAERIRRLTFGIISLVIGIAVLTGLMMVGAERWWRLLLFMPFVSAASGFFQWNDKTCVGLSRLQLRKLGDKAEKIEDAAELAQVRKQAARVQRKAFLAAILLTLIGLVLP
jgi:hypothetical protein